jgi:hypothetical protein
MGRIEQEASFGDWNGPVLAGRVAPTDQRASARVAVATMASASTGVKPPCPTALRYIAGPRARLGFNAQFPTRGWYKGNY